MRNSGTLLRTHGGTCSDAPSYITTVRTARSPVLLMRLLAAVTVHSILVAVAARPLHAQDTTAVAPSTRAVHVRIETARASYSTSDTIAVRLTLTNTGAVPLEVSGTPPWRAVQLIVTGADGRPVTPSMPKDFRHFISTRTLVMDPAKPIVLGYGGQRWTALQSFGYGPLAPGQYTLTAVPLVQGPAVDEDIMTVRSNQVTVTITP